MSVLSVLTLSPRRLVAAGLLFTLAIGLWLRWQLAGVELLPWLADIPFAYARHAHSHLGYYAVLIPLAWHAWRQRGLRISPALGLAYAAATVAATIGFLRAGYGLAGIIGSTAVGGIWLVVSFRTMRRAGRDSLLALVFPGTVLAMACIPVIALSLRRDPAFASAAVRSFLAALLFLVVAPTALAQRGVVLRLSGVIAVGSAGALGAAALGMWPAILARLGLAGYALWWLTATQRVAMLLPLRLAWQAAALGLLAMAVGLVPNVHDVGIGAVHFLVLGPLLPSLVAEELQPAPSARGWWIYLGGVALLSGALVWRGMFGGSVMATLSAVGGSWVVLWWTALLARQAYAPYRQEWTTRS